MSVLPEKERDFVLLYPMEDLKGVQFAFGTFCLAHSTSSKEEAGMHKVAPEQRDCADYQVVQ